MPRLWVRLLGTFEARLDDEPVRAFKYAKVRALLAYLMVEAEQAHPREVLAELLWPQCPEHAARQSLSQALSTLRRAIGERQADPPFLIVTYHTLQFNLASDHWLDVVVFREHLEACPTGHRDAMCETCRIDLEQAIALYHDDFLANFPLCDSPDFEAWARSQRQRLQRYALDALHMLAASALARHAFEEALPYARRQLALDPWRESAHRQVMWGLALSGQRNAALAHYETCRSLLKDELNVAPEAATTALYERLKAGGAGQSRGASTRWERPPPPSASLVPHNLPAHIAPFIGRDAELAELHARLEDPTCRLITLVGPGGSGKTRLALEVAKTHLAHFPHGVYYVPLVILPSPEALVPAIAQAMGLTGQPPGQTARRLSDMLNPKTMLLILDNFEHLLNGMDIVLRILKAAPRVKIMVTSRVRLNAHGECLFPVEGMRVAEDGKYDLAGAAKSDAVQLFLCCTCRMRAGFSPTEDELAAITRICQLVRGMPLAILLAASWMPVLSPAEIAAHLADDMTSNFDFLRADWDDIPARQRSMRAVFDYSWHTLSIRERAVLQALSVFRGGFTREAAEQVIGVSLRELRALVDKSMVQPITPERARKRYEIHPLMRQYVAQKLAHVPPVQKTACKRHSVYYTTALRHWAVNLQDTAQQAAGVEIGQDLENIRAALDWAVAQGDTRRVEQTREDLIIFMRGLGQEE